MQGSKGDTNIADSGHSRGRSKRKNSIETYTLAYAKQTASRNMPYHAGNPNPGLCDNAAG